MELAELFKPSEPVEPVEQFELWREESCLIVFIVQPNADRFLF